MRGTLDKLTVKGFKSIEELMDFELGQLNIIIGANGAGKSNFIQIFRLLMAMINKNFSQFINIHGGADGFLYNGLKITSEIGVEFAFKPHSGNDDYYYQFKLIPGVDGTFVISERRKYFKWLQSGYPDLESHLYNFRNNSTNSDDILESVEDRDTRKLEAKLNVESYIYNAISKWMVYHFHDSSHSARMRRYEIIEDCDKLRDDAANIAPFLLNLKQHEIDCYHQIVNAIQLVLPFFDDFRLDVKTFGEAEKVRLSWTQKGSDFPMQPYHLSDGSIRFICLVTALLQPEPPSMIIIDEPELGLHPAAIVILAELIEVASRHTQVIVATQSTMLIDQFAIENIIVANRKEGASTFTRLKEEDFSQWLEDYSIGELWTKNVIVGGPVYE